MNRRYDEHDTIPAGDPRWVQLAIRRITAWNPPPADVRRLLAGWRHFERLTGDQVAEVVAHFAERPRSIYHRWADAARPEAFEVLELPVGASGQEVPREGGEEYRAGWQAAMAAMQADAALAEGIIARATTPATPLAAAVEMEQQQRAYARLAGVVGGVLSMRGRPFMDDGVLLDRIATAYARFEQETDAAGGAR